MPRAANSQRPARLRHRLRRGKQVYPPWRAGQRTPRAPFEPAADLSRRSPKGEAGSRRVSSQPWHVPWRGTSPRPYGRGSKNVDFRIRLERVEKIGVLGLTNARFTVIINGRGAPADGDVPKRRFCGGQGGERRWAGNEDTAFQTYLSYLTLFLFSLGKARRTRQRLEDESHEK